MQPRAGPRRVPTGVRTADARAEDFDGFYARTAPHLVRQVFAMTGDLSEAQDVVQEAFVRAWQRWRTVQEYDVPEAWVRRVAMRLAVSRWRRARNAFVAGTRAHHREPAPELSPDYVATVTALRALPEAQRTAIVLHHIADLSVEEVAAQTGAPVGTVKARLSRGRAALAALLDPDDPGTEVTSSGPR